MGCVLGLLSSAACTGLACCCTGTAISCCCRGCCSCKNSTSSRIVYAVILFLGIVVSAIFLIPDLQPQLQNIPNLCETDKPNSYGNQVGEKECVYSVNAIYRVFFGITIFFLLMAILMIDVHSSKDCRSGFQNGFWFFKFAGVIGLTVAAFYLPPKFSIYWMYMCIVASTLYIIIQLILTIDFAYFLNEYLGEQYDNTNNKCFLCLLFSITMICYGLALILTTLLFLYYTNSEGCTTNKVILSVNFSFCLVFSGLSVMRKVQERITQAGLLQSSIMTLYVMFITWTAFSNQPDKQCNPGLKNIFKYGNNKASYEFHQKGDTFHLKPESIVALLLSCICILYSALRNSTESSKILGSNNSNNNNENEAKATDVKERGTAYDDEGNETAYSYSFFHFIMFLAAMYTTMCFTNWMDPSSKEATDSFYANSTAFWFKVVSAWLSIFLYTWTLVAPILFPERDFS